MSFQNMHLNSVHIPNGLLLENKLQHFQTMEITESKWAGLISWIWHKYLSKLLDASEFSINIYININGKLILDLFNYYCISTYCTVIVTAKKFIRSTVC